MDYNIVYQESLTEHQRQQIDLLWDTEYPLNLKGRLSVLLDQNSNFQHFIIEENHHVIGWAVLFDNEGERRFSIIVDSSFKGKGLGKRLLDAMKDTCSEFYGWVIDHNYDVKANGEFYQTPLTFYLKNGFEIVPNVRLETPIISALKIKFKIIKQSKSTK